LHITAVQHLPGRLPAGTVTNYRHPLLRAGVIQAHHPENVGGVLRGHAYLLPAP